MTNKKLSIYDRDHYIRAAHQARSETFHQVLLGISSEVKKNFSSHREAAVREDRL